MSDVAAVKVDETKIKKAIEAEIPLYITSYTLPHDMEIYMNEVTACFLRCLNLESIFDYITYCLGELTTNAKKANTKRIYFQEKGLDLTDPKQYEEGMKTFKNDTINNLDYYLQKQKESGLYIKLVLQKKDNWIKFEVRNNSPITSIEEKRMNDKIANARQYDSVQDAFAKILDDSEGAGLGIIIMILMLRKIGMKDENFSFTCDGVDTIVRVVIDLNEETKRHFNTITDDLISKLDKLTYPSDSLAKLNEILEADDAKMSDVSNLICKDVSLSAYLLKLVNSEQYKDEGPCTSIPKALQIVGIDGIKDMLNSQESAQKMTGDSSSAKEIWEHANRIAFFSYNLLKNFYPEKSEMLDDVYTLGLLHDIGKIVIYCNKDSMPEIYDKMEREKKIPQNIFEQLEAGINHAEIGAKLAEKWNYPTELVQAIRYHHKPEYSPEENRNYVEIVYLANMLSFLQSGEVEMYQFDANILKKYNLDSLDKLKAIGEKLEKAFTESDNSL